MNDTPHNPNAYRIYIASSWKNAETVREIATSLAAIGYGVYDFTDGDMHFSFNAADIERFAGKREEIDWLEFNECPEAHLAFKADRFGINWADAVLMLLPCGRSAHLEAGYAVGRNKPLIIYGDLPKGEFETMYGFAYDCIRRTESMKNDIEKISMVISNAISSKLWGLR